MACAPPRVCTTQLSGVDKTTDACRLNNTLCQKHTWPLTHTCPLPHSHQNGRGCRIARKRIHSARRQSGIGRSAAAHCCLHRRRSALPRVALVSGVSLLCLLCLVFRCVGDASRACVSCVVWRDTSAFTHHVWSLQRVVPLFGLPRVRASSKHLACVLRVCCVCAVCVQRVCIGER